MRTFAKIGLSFVALVGVAVVATHASIAGPADTAHAGFQWACQDTGRNSMQCTVRNNTQAAGELCTDVVKVCKDGDHHAQLCSGRLRSGEVTSRVVHDFQPKVKFFAGCMGIEYRDTAVQ